MSGLSRVHRTEVPTYNGKWTLKGTISIFVVLLILGFIVWMIIGSSKPKEPITSNNMWNILTEHGYEPEDVTEYYCAKDPNFNNKLIKCIAFEKDDIHFEFFEFNNKNSAVDIYGQAHTRIIVNYNAINKIEISHKIANYNIYSLDSLGKYNVAIYVENTALYAYCNSENKNEINKILDAIDYLEP